MKTRKKYIQLLSPNHQVLACSSDASSQRVPEVCHQQIFGRSGLCENCPMEAVLKTKQTQTITLQAFPDLPPLFVELCPLLDHNGKVVAVLEEISLFGEQKEKVPPQQELSHIREQQRQLQKHALKKHLEAEEIERTAERHKNFLRLAAHQMQTPISILRGYLELFLADPSKQNYAVLDRTLVELADLVQKMVLFSSEHGSTTGDGPSDIVVSVRESTERFADRHPSHEILFSSPHADGEVFLKINPQRTPFVINALLENAIKYSPEGTKIIASVEADNRTCKISILDEGGGISEEEQEKIFEPFYRGSREKPGSGLGLSIVKKMVEARHGKIFAESELGKFTKITLEMPRHFPEKSLTEKENPAESRQ